MSIIYAHINNSQTVLTRASPCPASGGPRLAMATGLIESNLFDESKKSVGLVLERDACEPADTNRVLQSRPQGYRVRLSSVPSPGSGSYGSRPGAPSVVPFWASP